MGTNAKVLLVPVLVMVVQLGWNMQGMMAELRAELRPNVDKILAGLDAYKHETHFKFWNGKMTFKSTCNYTLKYNDEEALAESWAVVVLQRDRKYKKEIGPEEVKEIREKWKMEEKEFRSGVTNHSGIIPGFQISIPHILHTSDVPSRVSSSSNNNSSSSSRVSRCCRVSSSSSHSNSNNRVSSSTSSNRMTTEKKATTTLDNLSESLLPLLLISIVKGRLFPYYSSMDGVF